MSTDDRKKWRDWTSEKITSGVVDTALLALSRGWSLINKGPIAWISERLLEYAWEKTGDKFIRWTMRKGWLAVDKVNGAIKVKKVNKAKDENNPDDYWTNIGSL